MVSLICVGIYWLSIIITIVCLAKYFKYLYAIRHLKSTIDIRIVGVLIVSSILLFSFSGLINIMFFDSNEFIIAITICSTLIFIFSILFCKIHIVINDSEIIKVGLFRKTLIKIKDVKSIKIENVIKVESDDKTICIKTMFYEKEINDIKKFLSEIKIQDNKLN